MARNPNKDGAYFLVDVSELPDDMRKELIEDALSGGSNFGVRVVEEVINGPARQALFGVYYGEDEAKWADAKAQFGVTADEVDDGEVTPVGEADPNAEAKMRQKAQEIANAQADKIRTAEMDEIEKIVNPAADEKPVNKAKR